MEGESSTSATSPKTSETIFTHLHSLLASQSSLTAALPYLHPYAPASYKGKAKAHTISPQDQLDVLAQLKRGVDEARRVLDGVSGEEEQRVKLMRAMKDVPSTRGFHVVMASGDGKTTLSAKPAHLRSTHQQALVPTTTSLASLVPSSSVFPSRLSLLTPVELLQSLSETIGIQAYLEESQFGLLKTSLTLAGTCFVVDLDLETDAVAGNEEDDEMEVDSRDPRDARSEGLPEREGKGRVRLSKISSNHVRGDVTGKSDWVARVIKEKMESYLELWNESKRGWSGMVELEKRVQGLERELRDLKELDVIMEQAGVDDTTGVDWFMELEQISTKLGGLFTDHSLFPPSTTHIFPSFSLLPPLRDTEQATFCFRPSRIGEAVPSPPGLTDDIEDQWLAGRWVLEYARSSDLDDGFVVRRTWLSEEAEEGDVNWDGLIRVEHLLYRQTVVHAPETPPPMTFPYTSDFVHHIEGSADQRWAMAEPGPEAFAIGRIGLTKSFAGFKKLVELLRTQATLNSLFMGVFASPNLDDAADDSGDIEEDVLSRPAAVPVTVTLHQRSLRLAFPVVVTSEDDPTVLLATLTPSGASPFIDVQWTANGELSNEARDKIDKSITAPSTGMLTAVEVVRRMVADLS